MSMVQQAVEISAPLHTVYEQLATFENYPRFMTGVREVKPIGNDQTHWVMDVEGHQREFDAQITERSLDERVSWATTDGPLLSETITLRPMGETRTQIVAQLEADVAFLLPSDRHGTETLNKRLRADLNAFKGLIETGKLGEKTMTGASSKRFATPASVATRVRGNRPKPGAGWGTSAGEFSNANPDSLGTLRPNADRSPNAGTYVDITSAPGISDVHDLDDVLAPGTRITSAPPVRSGSASMGSRRARDTRTDGIISEEERGGAGY
jgi:hypothetical protein